MRFTLALPASEQGKRSRWRALYLVVKAKLEAVSSGIVSMEDEFLAQTVMNDGETVWMAGAMMPMIYFLLLGGWSPWLP